MNQGALIAVTATVTKAQQERIKKLMDKLGANSRAAVSAAIAKTTYDARNVAVKAVPVYMGALKQSIEAHTTPTTGRIWTPLNYAAAVEYGSKPHWAPLKPLIRYAYLKLGIPEKEAFPVAKAIQKKIAQRGTKAKPYMMPAYDLAKATFNKNLETALGNAVKDAKNNG